MRDIRISGGLFTFKWKITHDDFKGPNSHTYFLFWFLSGVHYGPVRITSTHESYNTTTSTDIVKNIESSSSGGESSTSLTSEFAATVVVNDQRFVILYFCLKIVFLFNHSSVIDIVQQVMLYPSIHCNYA
jgi:hypothetical protein